MRAPSRSDSCRSPVAAQFVDDVVRVLVLADERVHIGVGDGLHRGHEIVDAVGVDGHAETHLGLDLVALGHRDVAHVVAETGELQRTDLGQPARRTCPRRDPRRHQWIRHVAGDRLARRAHAGEDVGELAVAVGGLVQVHEVHVDLRVRQLDVRLRVEVQHRLLQRAEAVDPHLGGRERVHPRDDADAPRIGVDLEHLAMDPDRLGQHRLEHDGQRDGTVGVELLHDGGRLIGDLSQRVVAVEGLTAGEEPDLAIVVACSSSSLHFCP